ncbi:unnamed protein product [Psylliodes chrysocephalus]|uniref:C-type lectin domain-containing protein n=1 Tax=Psylliodes chrysocephalus TaxID=3402493 RepID=A0A9P0D060_9CUCU|nr:unnamed protein product [Psylliodes chrysocephala]
MHSFLAISCVFICFTTTIAFVKHDTKLWSHTFKLGEKSYFIETEKMNFDDANNFCKGHNMQLVAIANATENTKMYNELNEMGDFKDKSALWTSGTKLAKSDDWVWLTSMEIITFFDWGTGEPNNAGGNEYCLALHPNFYSSGHWNDVACSELLYPLCETV